jgi:hypothetical protein
MVVHCRFFVAYIPLGTMDRFIHENFDWFASFKERSVTLDSTIFPPGKWIYSQIRWLVFRLQMIYSKFLTSEAFYSRLER